MKDYRSIFLISITIIIIFLISGCDGIFKDINISDVAILLADDHQIEREVSTANLRLYSSKYTLDTFSEDNIYKKVLNKLQKAAESDIKFKINYADTDNVNAMYIGNGKIIIYKGLIEKLKNKNQIAAVIAHEMGHGVRGHIVELLRSTVTNKIKKSALENMGVEEGVSEVAMFFYKNGYSRSQEKEADLYSIDLLDKAGYDINGPVEVMKILEQLNSSSDIKLLEYFQTHPNPGTRIDYMKEYIQKIRAK